VRADVDCYNCIPLNVEHDSEIRLDFRCVIGAGIPGGEFLNLVRTQTRVKRVLFENKKRLGVRDAVAARAAFRNCAKTRESRGNDISLITGIRLIERCIQVDKSSSFRIGHPLLERLRDPGIVIFHDKLGGSYPFARGKGFELFDHLSGTHGEKSIAPINRRKIVLLLRSTSQGLLSSRFNVSTL
jgi:hypothetical protein